MTKKVGIIGGGFIGTALAKFLNSKKYGVCLSFRSNEPEHKVSGVKYGYCNVDESSADVAEELLNVDSLVICIPPGIRKGVGDFYASRIKTIVKLAEKAKVKQLIFTSSTGIYTEGDVILENAEFDLTNGKTEVLYDAEQAVLTSSVKNKHTLRLGGLLGGDAHDLRHPGTFNVAITSENADAVVNMVMQADVVAAIEAILSNSEKAAETYNVVAPHHPTRQAFYRRVWHQFDPKRELPPLVKGNGRAGKWVDGNKLCRDLGFNYKFANWFTAFN